MDIDIKVSEDRSSLSMRLDEIMSILKKKWPDG